MAFSSLEALQAFGMGREMAFQDRQRGRQEQQFQRDEGLREGLSRAYNPATGQIDQSAGRRAYAEAGDIGGALEFDQRMTAIHGAQFTQNRDRLIAGASFLRDVHDEASFQAAIQRARAAGIDLADVPPAYDPQWVQGVVQIGTRLQQAQHYQEPTTFQQDLTGAGIDPRSTEGVQLLRNRYAPQPHFGVGPNGEMVVVQPQQSGPSPAAAPPAVGEVRRGYRFKGGDPASPQSWEAVGGAATSADTGRQDGGAFAGVGGAGSDPRTFP